MSKPNPVVRALRFTSILLGLLMLFAKAVPESVPVGAATSPTPALVRIDLSSPTALGILADYELPVIARLLDSGGQEYLLALANPIQQAKLAGQGLSLRVLDPDSREAVYYLLYSSSSAVLNLARTLVTILDDDGRQVVARATPAQAEQLLVLGIELRRLDLRPRVLWSQDKAHHLPRAITPDPIVQDMIAQVQSSTVYSYTGGFSGEWPVIIGGSPYTITTRYSRTDEPIQRATQYVYEHFESLGLPVQFHEYDLIGSGMRRNVVAEQRGSTQPERIYLITAHLDDFSQFSYLAPGADDNASGSTGVLVAADILSKYNFGCTLRYVLFTGEEQGLYGSSAYASDLHNLGENVAGVLNLDMISYNSDSLPIIDLHTRPGNAGDLAIANLFSDTVSAYNINLTPQILPDGIQYSDHASFWDYGYPGILGIEDNDDFTPFYHTINDRLATLDITYFTNFVKAAVGTLAHMGCLLDTPGNMTGVVYNAGNGDPLYDATVQASPRPNLSWSTITGMNGVYNLSVISGTYTVTVSAPGYPLYTTIGVHVTTDLTTTLDLPLCAPVTGTHFIYQPFSPEPGDMITLTGGITAGSSPITYTWDFGDSTAIMSAEGLSVVTHTFPNTTTLQTYHISLSVVNLCSNPPAVIRPITFNPFLLYLPNLKTGPP